MTNGEILARALDGIDALRARQKEMAKEHAERIKGLNRIQAQVRHRKLVGELSLDGDAGLSLSPELVRLIDNPLQGL